jgi:hypothetical protein
MLGCRWNWPQWLVAWGNEALRWQLARPYGMFIRMTGTEGVRPEIAIEAAHQTNGPWIELPFRYKPTDPGRALRKVPLLACSSHAATAGHPG